MCLKDMSNTKLKQIMIIGEHWLHQLIFSLQLKGLSISIY